MMLISCTGVVQFWIQSPKEDPPRIDIFKVECLVEFEVTFKMVSGYKSEEYFFFFKEKIWVTKS